jgi:hypothetical protein
MKTAVAAGVTDSTRSTDATVRRLTMALAGAATIAAGGSLLRPELLDGTAVTIGNLRGTSLVVLVAGVPALVAGMSSMFRGSLRGFVVCVGAAMYLTYQGVMFCFATPINPLFLAYVATLGLGSWTVLALVRTAGHIDAPTYGVPDSLWRLAPGLLATFATLNGLAWLARAAPITWTGDTPGALDGSGLLTSPVWVQDLALWIPAALVSAWLMWHRRPIGVLLTGGMLTFYLIECLSVASDQWWGARADDTHPEVASMAVVPAALVVAALVAVPLMLVLTGLGRHLEAGPGRGHTDALSRGR